MAQLTVSFDLGSRTVTSASIDGRLLGVGGVTGVVLSKGMAEIINKEGGNLLAEFQGPAIDHTAAQLNIAKAFGAKVDEGQRS